MMTDYPLISESTGKFFEDWGFIVQTQEDPDGGYYGWERYQLNTVKRETKNAMGEVVKDHPFAPKDIRRIWSVVESGDCGCLWICAGERSVNVVHYMVSTKPWDDIKEEWLDYKCIECQEKESEEE